MLPPVNIFPNLPQAQTPLVNTAMPGSNAVYVPYDNVSPSVSNAQVENNTKSGGAEATQQAAQESADAPAAESPSAVLSGIIQQNQIASAQATFLTQLLAQDGSPEAQTILVQYEKLVALSNVKYKPSNAGRPAPQEPASMFGEILQQEQPAPAAPPIEAAANPQLPPVQTVVIAAPPMQQAVHAYAQTGRGDSGSHNDTNEIA